MVIDIKKGAHTQIVNGLATRLWEDAAEDHREGSGCGAANIPGYDEGDPPDSAIAVARVTLESVEMVMGHPITDLRSDWGVNKGRWTQAFSFGVFLGMYLRGFNGHSGFREEHGATLDKAGVNEMSEAVEEGMVSAMYEEYPPQCPACARLADFPRLTPAAISLLSQLGAVTGTLAELRFSPEAPMPGCWAVHDHRLGITIAICGHGNPHVFVVDIDVDFFSEPTGLWSMTMEEAQAARERMVGYCALNNIDLDA